MRGKSTVVYMKRRAPATAPPLPELKRRFRITHPFHPLLGREYEVLEFRRDWGRNYVAFLDENVNLCAVPIPWTDLEQIEDPFVSLSDGRAWFRPGDLLALAELIEAGKW
ncbi:MAG: DUF5372 family protein [bacterium]